jgi:peptidoglycan LD-endopeptidase CwlK
METVSLDRLKLLHPSIRGDAIQAYTEAVKQTHTGVHPFITQTRRTFEEQAHLYAQGRTAPGQIVTYAKPGQSYHNWDLALDFVLLIGGKMIWKVDENWMKVVNIFKAHGFEAGIDWAGKKKDAPHFEKRFGHHWSELMALKEAGKVDCNGYITLSSSLA